MAAGPSSDGYCLAIMGSTVVQAASSRTTQGNMEIVARRSIGFLPI